MADLVAAIAQTLDDMPAETSLVSNELGVDGVALAKLRDAVLRSAIKQLEEIFCDLFGLFIFGRRSEEHTSELQSLMRISYAVFCLKKKKTKHHITTHSSSNAQT